MKLVSTVSFLVLITIGCQSVQDQESTLSPIQADSIKRSYEAISLLGDTLYSEELPPNIQVLYDSALREAERDYQNNPNQAEHLIWWGRRLGQVGRYREGIQVFTRGMKKFPATAELYRHRGQYYIAIRQFDQAIRDFEKSAQLLKNQPVRMEPDGMLALLPSDHQPASLQFNVYYHLGLAYYLTGQYGNAAQAYETCLTYCDRDDETAAVADWLYMTYRRLGEDEVAERTLALIQEDMQIGESQGYFERLLMYKGYVDPESLLDADDAADNQGTRRAKVDYGMGNYYLSEGDTLLGKQIFRGIVDGRQWATIDYIAAEADLARKR